MRKGVRLELDLQRALVIDTRFKKQWRGRARTVIYKQLRDSNASLRSRDVNRSARI